MPLLRRRTLLVGGANWRRLVHRYQELLILAFLCVVPLMEMFGFFNELWAPYTITFVGIAHVQLISHVVLSLFQAACGL